MTVLLTLALLGVAVAGSVVALTPDPERQAVTLSVFGLLLGAVFVLAAAPDVALSQLAVGTALVPLLVLLTVRTVRRRSGRPERSDEAERDEAERAERAGHPERPAR
jgi:energy-converting hydrogenase B subunit D